jgi:hypothetical protein
MKRVDYDKLVVRELIDAFNRQELDINPWYQRRSVWTKPQKSYLINTILEQKPVPSLYIRHYLNIETEKSVKEVVDGQQRIRSILEYVADEFAARHPVHPKSVKYSELSPTERRDFLMTNLSIGYLIEADDADVIEIFGRLNSVAKTLNEQEKRNARFSGEVKQFCLKQAAKRVALWRDLCIFTANDIARMVEVEFVSELTLSMLSGLTDHSSTIINNFYEKYDESFEQGVELDAKFEKLFSKIVSLPIGVIKDTIFSRVPLFFSLCVLLDSIDCKIENSKLERGLFSIDRMYNKDVPLSQRNADEAQFILACTATTQRIRQRKIRDQYLRKELEITR